MVVVSLSVSIIIMGATVVNMILPVSLPRRPILLDRGLLRIRSLHYGSIAALIVALGEFGILFALPLYVQGVLGFTALNTSFLIVSRAVGTFLISGGTAQLAGRIAILGTVLAAMLAAATTANLLAVEGVDNPAQQQIVSVVRGSVGAAIPALSSMPGSNPEIQEAADEAMATATRITTLSAAGALLFGLLATVGLPTTPVRRDDEDAKATAEAGAR